MKSVGSMSKVTISLSNDKKKWTLAGKSTFAKGICTINCKVLTAPSSNYRDDEL